MTVPVEVALDKGARAARLNRDEALALASLDDPTDIHRLGRAALANRQARFGRTATYVVNAAINPSNICEGQCGFCRYRVRSGDNHAYTMTEEEIFDRLAGNEPTEVHIVGGMNRIWHFERYMVLIGAIRERWPAIHIKAFTAVEIDWFAKCENESAESILRQLKAAGLNALPGGGAELFSERFRAAYCPTKLSPQGWLEIHERAHLLGVGTNATILYGTGERADERVDHLLALRELQDRTRGFGCFIPLAYQASGDERGAEGPTPNDNLAAIALSRLVLDNFAHIKAYWPMIGLETAALGLAFGADDLDGTLGQERIAHAAGADTPEAVTRELMGATIRAGGFDPVERDGTFAHIETTADPSRTH